MNDNKLVALVKGLTKLIKEFKSVKETTPDEFIEQKFTVQLTILKHELYNHFLFLMRHIDFLERVLENFWSCYNLHLNAEILIVLMYIVMFILNEENWKHISQMLQEIQFKHSLQVIEYFLVEENLIDTTQAACKVFDRDYVLENIVYPFLNNGDLINNIYKYLSEKPKSKIPKKSTALVPRCATVTPRAVIAPSSVVEIIPFRSVPRPTPDFDKTAKRKLDAAYKENKKKAIELLKFARENAFDCAKERKKIEEEKICPPPIVACKKPPLKDNVVIKSTTASLMREAALAAKSKESEIQKIEALMQGAFDPSGIEKLDQEMRKHKEQHNLQEIERKHLEGLLTHEEAKLAKVNVVHENKLKMEEFKREREHILEEIEAWKEQEQEKIKLLVEKCQNIEKAAREAGEKMVQNKRMHAKMVENETKDLLTEAYEKRQRELGEKVKLIQELRALEQVRSLQIKEFDPTETSNFGLLCEMSIAELQERLGLLKVQLRDDLEKKKNVIIDNKKKQQDMIVSMKSLIDNYKQNKLKPQKYECKLKLTPEIIALRERLRDVRNCNRISQI